MHVVSDSTVKVAWSVGSVGDLGLMLSLAVKSAFVLKCDSTVVPHPERSECVGDLYSEGENGRRALVYPSDFVLFKPRADILLVGAAHFSGGKFTPHPNVALRVGEFIKAGYVYWDRSDQPGPTDFGPVPPNGEPRRSKVGTYKGNWLKERWPWFPDDFDWSYFNAAPEDQQVSGYLRGDEELEFRNLHPTHPLYRSRLPGLRARAFVQIEVPSDQPEFREVKLNLDTLWIDIEAEEVVLVWRGLTAVRSLKLKEVTHLAALREPLESPLRSKEEMREWMLQRVREEREGGPPTPEEVAEEAAAS